ncbi:MAG: type 1 periplasmic binding fold superfamily protein [Bacteroidota bacterium]
MKILDIQPKRNAFLKPWTILAMGLMLFTASCGDDDDLDEEPMNEEETITTVIVTLTNMSDPSDVITSSIVDPDGDGGVAPAQTAPVVLDSNTTYSVQLGFLDESDPADVENIGEEILDEDDEHLVCFAASGDITITRTDTDGMFEVGLQSRWETGNNSGNSTVTVTLKHQPGIKDGTCPPGETDVEVGFAVTIQ